MALKKENLILGEFVDPIQVNKDSALGGIIFQRGRGSAGDKKSESSFHDYRTPEGLKHLKNLLTDESTIAPADLLEESLRRIEALENELRYELDS